MDFVPARRGTAEPSSLVINATLAPLPNEDVPDSDVIIQASLLPGLHTTIAEFARELIEQNPEDWLLRVASARAVDAPVVRISYGSNLETIVYRGDVATVQDETTIPTVGITLAKFSPPLDLNKPVAKLMPKDSVYDHMMFTFFQSGMETEPNILVRVAPRNIWCESARGDEGDSHYTHRIRVWPSKYDPFVAVRMDHVAPQTPAIHAAVPEAPRAAVSQKPKKKRGPKPKPQTARKESRAEEEDAAAAAAAAKKPNAKKKRKEKSGPVEDAAEEEKEEPVEPTATKPKAQKRRKDTKAKGVKPVAPPLQSKKDSDDFSAHDSSTDEIEDNEKKQRWWTPKTSIWNEPPRGAIKLTFTKDEMDILHMTYCHTMQRDKKEREEMAKSAKTTKKRSETEAFGNMTSESPRKKGKKAAPMSVGDLDRSAVASPKKKKKSKK